MRAEFLPFHVASIEKEEIDQVRATLESGWLTMGPRVQRFEDDFAAYVGARHAIAVSSGTAALHLALAAAGVGPGDEVIVPTMTFVATAEAVQYLGAEPVLVDSVRDTLNIDPVAIEEAVTRRTKAIVPVHFGGQPCDMEAIEKIAATYGLKVVEDAAHALPAAYGARRIGAIGDLTCFSFYATKTITTGEGGMITTDSDAYAERTRIWRLHGISKDAWKRYTAEGSWYYEVVDLGYKYNLTDVAAAMGIEQLKKCDQFWEARRRIVARYQEGLAGLGEVETPVGRPEVRHAWHLYVLRLNRERLRISRADFIRELKSRNIGASVHFIPLHMHPYHQGRFGYRPGDFPIASEEYGRVVSLPVYPRMTEADVESVIEAVTDVVRSWRR